MGVPAVMLPPPPPPTPPPAAKSTLDSELVGVRGITPPPPTPIPATFARPLFVLVLLFGPRFAAVAAEEEMSCLPVGLTAVIPWPCAAAVLLSATTELAELTKEVGAPVDTWAADDRADDEDEDDEEADEEEKDVRFGVVLEAEADATSAGFGVRAGVGPCRIGSGDGVDGDSSISGSCRESSSMETELPWACD